MYGILREIGASVSLEQCDLEEAGGFTDHICNNEEDLDPFNCKRSKYEVTEPGEREVCMEMSSLISCKAGFCKNISRIWECDYKDR